MKTYNSVLIRSQLFHGIHESELDSMLSCLNTKVNSYKKGAYIYRHGDAVTSVGFVLSGAVHISKDDYWGNRTIVSEIGFGQLFGEAFACSANRVITVNVVAATDCEVMMFDVNKMLTTCSSSCSFHTLLIHNLVTVLAGKNRMLTGKINHMAQRRLRDKLLAYLSDQAATVDSATFEIPFNRQELADYLSVDRSALSNELGKLQKEGVLTYHKNSFTLL